MTDLLSGNAIEQIAIGLITLFVAFISGHLFLKYKVHLRIKNWFTKSSLLTYYNKDDILKAKEHFIPNQILIQDFNDKDITPFSLKQSSNTIESLAKLIRNGSIKNSFLIAPTGVGKTTYLLNLFDYYSNKSMFSNSRRMILGHFHKAETQAQVDRIIKEGKANNTIIILDGFDEFYHANFKNSQDFWMKFNDRWEMLREKLAYFGLVIIAIREQFLDISTNHDLHLGLIGTAINNLPLNYIKLKPFTWEQSKAYVESRYSTSRRKPIIEKTLRNLTPKFKDLLSHPLILSMVEYISNDFIKSTFSSKFELFDSIVEGWFEREIENNKLLRKDKKNLKKFCQNLALQIATKDSEAELNSKTISYIADFELNKFIASLENRSLLKKNDDNRTILEFAHSSIMEFFLVQASVSNADREIQTPFYKFSFAKEMLLEYRLKKINGNLNLDYEIIPPTLSVNGVDQNTPTIGTMKKWTEVFEQFSPNNYLQKELDKNLLGNIMKYDQDFLSKLKPFKNLIITKEVYFSNKDFLNTNQICLNFVSLFKDLIFGLILFGKIEDEDLECFEGISQLRLLLLGSSSHKPEMTLTGKGLNFFKKSAAFLTVLHLNRLNLVNNDLSVFKTFYELQTVLLIAPKITDITCFSKATKITDLSIHTDVSNNDLKSFIEPLRLQSLNLSNSKIEGDLKFLHNSYNSIVEINLSNTKIVDISRIRRMPSLKIIKIKGCSINIDFEFPQSISIVN